MGTEGNKNVELNYVYCLLFTNIPEVGYFELRERPSKFFKNPTKQTNQLHVSMFSITHRISLFMVLSGTMHTVTLTTRLETIPCSVFWHL